MKGFQWHTVMPVQNPEISTKIDVYNYRKAQGIYVVVLGHSVGTMGP